MAYRERALLLYRHSLKQILSWSVRREIFYAEVSVLLVSAAAMLHRHQSWPGHAQAEKLREAFEQNRHLVRCSALFVPTCAAPGGSHESCRLRRGISGA